MRAFQCLHSGLYFPPDYYKMWGIKYGIGLGPEPVSEIMDTAYHLPKVEAFQPGSEITMHPMGITHGTVQMVEVTQAEYDANCAVCSHEDQDYVKRTKIIVDKQKAKSKKLAEEIYTKSQEI